MKNKNRITLGLLLTAIAFVISNLLGSRIHLNSRFLPYSFVSQTSLLIISIGLIYGMRRYVNYKISLPKFKTIFKPILLALLATIVVNALMGALTVALGGKGETHIAFARMSPLQIFLFVFIYASIAEELLFRGFLMNILSPLYSKGIKIFKRHISVPVLISALVFGLAHLILITTGAGGFFLMRTVIFTTVLGIIAGYYQEKYDNNAYSIIVHMAGNFMGLLATILVHVSGI